MATVFGAAIAACGDDDGSGAGGGGGGGTGAGGGAGGGGGGPDTTVDVNIRFAQLIPDAVTAPINVPDAGLVYPGIRICIQAGGAVWAAPLPEASSSPLGIPPFAISGYSFLEDFPNVQSNVAVYLATEFDAETAAAVAGAAKCVAAAADADLDPILETSIDPTGLSLADGDHLTAVLTGVINNSPAGMAAQGLEACDGNCPGPQISLIADDLTSSAGGVTVRVINGVPNAEGPLEVCVVPVAPPGAPYPLLLGAGPTFGDPVALGEASDYFVRSDITGGNQLAAVPRPGFGVDGGTGTPCTGLAIPTSIAAGGGLPTPDAITGPYNGATAGGSTVALAVEETANGQVLTFFLVGGTDLNPADENGYGAFIAPILDNEP